MNNERLGKLKRVPAMDICLGARRGLLCFLSKNDLKIKYGGSEGSISNVDLGLLQPNKQLMFSFVTFWFC